ncbi:MAG TPA: type II toxin-antitoxin system RelE/ParE family toxin [Candidatus Acidoferrum sp.]|nr:type II toxin-antitoxin system RelE/ParE family toxin [Candidatus Acidoferrum sp.]
MKAGYAIRPKADQDIDEQAYYFASEASPEVGHRFILAVHETLQLLSSHPEMGWIAHFKVRELASLRAFPVTGFEKMLILYLPSPDGVEILRVIHGSRNWQALLRRERKG